MYQFNNKHVHVDLFQLRYFKILIETPSPQSQPEFDTSYVFCNVNWQSSNSPKAILFGVVIGRPRNLLQDIIWILSIESSFVSPHTSEAYVSIGMILASMIIKQVSLVTYFHFISNLLKQPFAFLAFCVIMQVPILIHNLVENTYPRQLYLFTISNLFPLYVHVSFSENHYFWFFLHSFASSDCHRKILRRSIGLLET